MLFEVTRASALWIMWIRASGVTTRAGTFSGATGFLRYGIRHVPTAHMLTLGYVHSYLDVSGIWWEVTADSPGCPRIAIGRIKDATVITAVQWLQEQCPYMGYDPYTGLVRQFSAYTECGYDWEKVEC